MFGRPSDNSHTPFGNIYLSRSPDLIHWGKHRFVMGVRGGWESTKVGAGPVPIETPQGWLLFYQGVLTSCNGFVYSFGAALLVALVFLGVQNPVLTYQISNMVTSHGSGWHLLTAAAFISMILPMLVFFSLQRFFVRGMLAGSVKG